MKRIFSLVMAVLMVASAFAVGSYAEAGYEGMSVVQVEALAFETQPTFDGAISEAEWGAPTVQVKGSEAADLTAYKNNYKNPVFAWDEIDPENSIAKKINYDLWFRWDANYYYIGANVYDPDGYLNENNREGIWNGDCLQFKIDPVGPNGIEVFNDETYDYTTTAFNYEKYKTPWSDIGSVCSIGAAVYPGQKRPFQAYEMTKKLLLNGDRSDLPEEQRSLIYVTPASAENGNVTTYELAINWSTIFCFDYDPFQPVDPAVNTSTQIYPGKTLGVSTVVLNATPGAKNFNAFLAWGSGICGKQHDANGEWFPFVNGGSNAVILSDKNALDTSKTVAVPAKADDKPIEFVEKGIYAAAGSDSYYFGINEDHPKEGVAIEMDIALLGTNIVDENSSMVGFFFGNNGTPDENGKLVFYSLAAGYDIATKTFVVGNAGWENGFKDATNVIVRSEQFDWTLANPDEGVPADWHRLGIKIDNATNTVTLTCDGEVVLTWTDPRVYNYNDLDGTTLQVIPYGTTERLMDNLFIGTVDYELGSGIYTEANTLRNFSFDSTDTAFQKAPIYKMLSMAFENIEIKCHDAETEYGNCGHNMGKIVAANADKIVYGCYYCAEEATEAVANGGKYVGEDINPDHALLGGGEPEPGPGTDPEPGDDPVDPNKKGTGDANGDGKTNIKDAMAIAKHVADWKDVIKDAANADITGDGKINIKDAMEICKLVANG